jgi:hypothetical protein
LRHKSALKISNGVGKPFRSQFISPDDWLAAALKGGMEPAYAQCVRNVFVRTAERTLDGAADVLDDFQKVTRREPIRWRDHAEKHRDEFLQRITSK